MTKDYMLEPLFIEQEDKSNNHYYDEHETKMFYFVRLGGIVVCIVTSLHFAINSFSSQER